jgi:dethiobiotin synthetase
MKPWFVTGTDTGVGKTRAAVGLLGALAGKALTVAGMKPIASGSVKTVDGLRNDDAMALVSASSVRVRYADVNPYAFAPAIAPHIAAADEGRTMELAVLERAYERLALTAEAVVIEGAGGWLTPLSESHTLADFAAMLDAQVILVVGLRLGCINHALLTERAIRAAGLTLAGWIGSAVDPAFERAQENRAALRARIAAPCLGILEHRPNASPAELADAINVDFVIRQQANAKGRT